MTEGVHMTVDTAEPGEVIAAVEASQVITSWDLNRLPAGDLLCRGVLFERKSWSDYASALTGKHGRTWDDQLRKLNEAAESDDVEAVYVLIDDGLGDAYRLTHSSINPKSLLGSAASVTARHGIPVIPCGNTHNLVEYAAVLARKHTEDPTTAKGLKATSISAGAPPVMRMYGCIPGVGPATARALYSKYPDVKALLRAAEHGDLTTIEGVGDKTAGAIRRTLRGEEVSA